MHLFHGIASAVGGVLQYIRANPDDFRAKLDTHLELSLFALLIAFVICFPLGVAISRSRIASFWALNLVGIARAVPSIAILFLAYPFLGLGFRPALLALAVLASPPILFNTNAGFRNVDPALREAAYGMGMTTAQVLRRIELPLALPVILAGVRTAAVEVIASATLATFIGGGGLGDYINEGLGNLTVGQNVLLVGVVSVSVLTLVAQLLLGGLELWARRVAVPQ